MNKDTVKLIEKITRAKMRLEGARREHLASCPSEDPHMPGPCTCGAEKTNSAIRTAIDELSLDDD